MAPPLPPKRGQMIGLLKIPERDGYKVYFWFLILRLYFAHLFLTVSFSLSDL